MCKCTSQVRESPQLTGGDEGIDVVEGGRCDLGNGHFIFDAYILNNLMQGKMEFILKTVQVTTMQSGVAFSYYC